MPRESACSAEDLKWGRVLYINIYYVVVECLRIFLRGDVLPCAYIVRRHQSIGICRHRKNSTGKI